MILLSRGSRHLAVTQADHARLAAEILSLFRLPELLQNSRRGELLRAVAEHDNGWWESDSAPEVDVARGLPLDFRAVSRTTRLAVWRRGVERFAGEAPYLAALVAAHGARIHSSPALASEWRELAGEMASRRDELLALSGRSATELAEDDAWVALADALALAACSGVAPRHPVGGFQATVRVEEELTTLGLEPFPLAGATRFAVACRELSTEPLAGGGDPARRLASAHWGERQVRVVPRSQVGNRVSRA